MKKLFNDLCEGLKLQGYKEQGGSDIFRIFTKDKNGIKVYINGMWSITTRYYYKDEVAVEENEKKRVQALNPKTKKWVKIDIVKGIIISHKKTFGAYKNIKKVGEIK